MNIYGKKDPKAAEKLVFRHFPAMNQGPRDGASYWEARHDLLGAASGNPSKDKVEPSGAQADQPAAEAPKQEPQSGGLMNWFRNLLSK